MNIKLLHLFHIFIISFLFIYVGINKTNIPKWMFTLLLIFGLFLIPYQSYKALINFLNGKNYYWYNLLHVFYIGPLLIWIGLKKIKTSNFIFDLLLLFGFASLGYHSYYLFKGE